MRENWNRPKGRTFESKRSVLIDAFPQSAFRHLERDAIVCIDVIRATTTLVTSVAQGRPTFPVLDLEQALELSSRLGSPLLASDAQEELPKDLAIENSPSDLAHRPDKGRPLVLMSTPGTRLIANSAECPAVYIASLQNISATAEHIASHHTRVAILGAGLDGELRCEDQMTAARIAADLVERGFESEDMRTTETLNRWTDSDVSLVGWGSSAEDLRSCGQEDDLEFVLRHVDDLDLVCYYDRGQVKPLSFETRAEPKATHAAYVE